MAPKRAYFAELLYQNIKTKTNFSEKPAPKSRFYPGTPTLSSPTSRAKRALQNMATLLCEVSPMLPARSDCDSMRVTLANRCRASLRYESRMHVYICS